MNIDRFKTVQCRYDAKYRPLVTNLVVYTLDNYFKGELVEDTNRALEYALDRLDTRMQVNATKNKGRIHVHSNCWYEFDLKTEE